ncbi:MAG: hypothetical protein HYT48_02925 [Candidatus Vogelbacteria bacterium]|nr:hypothetical protein [Candidatus Vogelbacteria bacterium]
MGQKLPRVLESEERVVLSVEVIEVVNCGGPWIQALTFWLNARQGSMQGFYTGEEQSAAVAVFDFFKGGANEILDGFILVKAAAENKLPLRVEMTPYQEGHRLAGKCSRLSITFAEKQETFWRTLLRLITEHKKED